MTLFILLQSSSGGRLYGFCFGGKLKHFGDSHSLSCFFTMSLLKGDKAKIGMVGRVLLDSEACVLVIRWGIVAPHPPRWTHSHIEAAQTTSTASLEDRADGFSHVTMAQITAQTSCNLTAHQSPLPHQTCAPLHTLVHSLSLHLFHTSEPLCTPVLVPESWVLSLASGTFLPRQAQMAFPF
jgi:hypothetical protein